MDDATTPPRRRRLGRVLLGLLVLGILMQLVPYGRAHTNPPVRTEPAWSSVQVEQLATAACADCHSNETKWPWYTNVAPASWLIQRDVDEGRHNFNWSEGCAPETDDIREVLNKGEMPPIQYKIKHGDARLSKAERKVLAAGLVKSITNASGTWRPCKRGGD